MIKKIIITLPILILLSGCAEMNSKFDCPMTPCVRCESLDQVNARVDRGEIGASTGTASTRHAIDRNYSCTQIYSIKQPCFVNASIRKPLRYSETVQHIWIAPFEDTSGNYHQESNIYTIAKPGHWIASPVKEINYDEE